MHGRSRGTPRIANRLLKRVRDYAVVLGNGNITEEIAKIALDKLEIDELGLELKGEQKEKFDEIIRLFYETEQYYFTLSYSLGVKYGEDLNKL